MKPLSGKVAAKRLAKGENLWLDVASCIRVFGPGVLASLQSGELIAYRVAEHGPEPMLKSEDMIRWIAAHDARARPTLH